MSVSSSLFIALRYLKNSHSNRLVALIAKLSTIGICVGVAVLIVGLSALNGFERELNNRILGIVPHFEITALKNDFPTSVSNFPYLINLIKDNKDIKAVAPFVQFNALLSNDNKLKPVQIKGIKAQDVENLGSLTNFIDKNQWQNFKIKGGLVLGAALAKELNLNLGESINLLLPDEGKKFASPKSIMLPVTAILTTQGQFDHNFALLDFKTAQQLKGLAPSQATGVELSLKDPFLVQKLDLHKLQNYTQELFANTWITKFGYMFSDIKLVRVIMYLAMFLVVVISCFGIISTLMMAVKDKSSDIAILRTMGAKNAFIKSIFLWYGIISALKGMLFGVILGVLTAINLTEIIKFIENLFSIKFLSDGIYFINFLPSELQINNVVFIVISLLFLSLIASFYPARRATMLLPAMILSSR